MIYVYQAKTSLNLDSNNIIQIRSFQKKKKKKGRRRKMSNNRVHRALLFVYIYVQQSMFNSSDHEFMAIETMISILNDVFIDTVTVELQSNDRIVVYRTLLYR